MLSEIRFKSPDYLNYKLPNSESGREITNLNKINIFIGQNNSGKSRFLRTLFKDNDFEFLLLKYDFRKISNFINEMKDDIENRFIQKYISEVDGILNELNEIIKDLIPLTGPKLKRNLDKLQSLSKKYVSIKKFATWSHFPNVITTRDPQDLVPLINDYGHRLRQLVNDIFPPDFSYSPHKIYIPILRGLRPIELPQKHSSIELDPYTKRTVTDYFPNVNTIESNIFTGLNLYDEVKKKLLGKSSERNKIKSFEDFLSCNFFNNESITLIPDIDKDVLLIGIGNSERSVYEFGDGIQTLIILLYPLFLNQDKDLLVFIEEPEISLHPGMQRIFIETLMRDQFSKFQYFITTHSNHFLDLSLDYSNISIYTFTKKADEEIAVENVSTGKTQILDLIGVRNSSIFLSNSSIWIEGITDRLYIRHFLKLFYKHNKSKKTFQEDLHYSFVEYSGSNITHYAFEEDSDLEKIKASALSNRILLIADSDNLSTSDTAKAKRIDKFERQLGDNFIKLPVREIENLLKENVIINVVAKFEKTTPDKLKYKEDKIQFDKYKGEYLGSFIDNNFSELKRNYADSTGTVRSKLKFCNTAIEFMNSYEDLSEGAKELTEKIYKFIANSNKF